MATRTRKSVAQKTGVNETGGNKFNRDNLTGRIGALLDQFEKQAQDSNFRMSVADYIRLLQIEKELDDNQPRDVKVTWVETQAGKSGSAQ